MRELGGQIIHKSPTLNVKTKGLSSVCGERCLETADMSMPKSKGQFIGQIAIVDDLALLLAGTASTVGPALASTAATVGSSAATVVPAATEALGSAAGQVVGNIGQAAGQVASGVGKTVGEVAKPMGEAISKVGEYGVKAAKEIGPDVIKHGSDITGGIRKNAETFRGQMDNASGSKYTRSPSITAHADDAQEFQKESTEHPEFPPKVIKQIVEDHKEKDVLEEFLRR